MVFSAPPRTTNIGKGCLHAELPRKNLLGVQQSVRPRSRSRPNNSHYGVIRSGATILTRRTDPPLAKHSLRCVIPGSLRREGGITPLSLSTPAGPLWANVLLYTLVGYGSKTRATVKGLSMARREESTVVLYRVTCRILVLCLFKSRVVPATELIAIFNIL